MNPVVVVLLVLIALGVGLLIGGVVLQPKRKFGMAEAYQAEQQLARMSLPKEVADQAALVAVVTAAIMDIPVTLGSEVKDHVAKVGQENAERRNEINDNEVHVHQLTEANVSLGREIATADADAARAQGLVTRYLHATA